jgi:hypothetical protein
MHKFILDQERENINAPSRINQAQFYSRLAVPAICDYKKTGDNLEYAKLWKTIEAKAEPDLQYMELDIRYCVVHGEMDRAVNLVVECSKVFESECPRRPGLSIINIVFNTCLGDDRIKQAEEMVRVSRELGHDYHANARSLCKYYIKREMSDCIWEWMREYSTDSSTTK